MKARGLDKDKIQLGIMDGLSGLMTVFREEFPRAKVQRCQVHVARNVLCKVPKKLKREVADKKESNEQFFRLQKQIFAANSLRSDVPLKCYQGVSNILLISFRGMD